MGTSMRLCVSFFLAPRLNKGKSGFNGAGMDYQNSFCLRFQFPDKIENTKSLHEKEIQVGERW